MSCREPAGGAGGRVLDGFATETGPARKGAWGPDERHAGVAAGHCAVASALKAGNLRRETR